MTDESAFSLNKVRSLISVSNMILEQHPDLQRLSPSEKLLLVSELWDDLAAHPAEVPVTREQIAELDRRMEAYREDPTRVTTWEAIKARILGPNFGSA